MSLQQVMGAAHATLFVDHPHPLVVSQVRIDEYDRMAVSKQ